MSTAVPDKPCTVIVHNDKGEPPSLTELKTALETGGTEQKVDALKKVIVFTLNGENLSQLLMTIIRFVMPSKEHMLKKLLLIYWEIVEKTNPDGKLKSEMILVCNALRSDLIHPNEYIRGSTLRLVCKLKEPEVLEPLLPSVRTNLEHRHSYVRKNAVLAVYSIYRNFDYLIPDAPELIYNFLVAEGDASCKRNAFIMLFNCQLDKAVEYLNTVLDQVASFGDMLQFIVVELIRKVCRTSPSEKSKYMRCIFTLLTSSSAGVQYESAGTLLSLSSAPSAVRAASSAYIHLLCNESDNNVKLIVLDRLLDIKKHYPKVLQDLLMDILRALATPALDIRRKTLDIALDLVDTKNIDEVVLVLKKEINKTQAKEYEKGPEYRQMLIQAIHQCAVKFPDVASNVVHLLMDFLGDSNVASAVDVIVFVREVTETYPALREQIIRKLLESLYTVKASKVFRASLWIIGEYCTSTADVDTALSTLRESLGELPLVDAVVRSELPKDGGKEGTKDKPVTHVQVSSATRVLADGTYATQSAFTEAPLSSSVGGSGPIPAESNQQLRVLLQGGDFFLASVLASTLVKLALRAAHLDFEPAARNAIHAESLLVITSIISLGKSAAVAQPIDPDSLDRLLLCLRILADRGIPDSVRQVWLKDCHSAFKTMLQDQHQAAKAAEKSKKVVEVQADDLIKIKQLRPSRAGASDMVLDDDEMDMTKAAGVDKDAGNNLSRVYQLTGYSDSLYAEAVVRVHQYDIALDVVVINQTSDTLINVTLELATLGDLKLCERPVGYTIAPREKQAMKASIKVSSTETAIIFGNLVFDVAGASSSDKNCVILNEIHIDILDYIAPGSCTDIAFRTMWADFEWENKVAVNTNFSDVIEFLNHIVKSTNMQCLTPASALAGECAFLSANLYAKSVFGEDALANVCVERTSEDRIAGYIRIRSKTQGIALSLGEKITMLQKRPVV